ncbi:hypothetical protein ACGF7U_10455 [Micromonospora sp. NPDC047670]|uniref:hypothetical protein n=1 Tax=Micromonospora sp. NPDC047670 TaxID=3364252 RepID=UPI003716712E
MLFGIYPGSVTGDDAGGIAAGRPDDPQQIATALADLQGRPGRPFLVRAYLTFHDRTPRGGPHPTATPPDAARYAGDGRRLELVAQYRSDSGDVAGYCDFVREVIDQYGAVTDRLQITEEPNVPGNPVLDGYYPNVADAVVAGVSAAREHARRLGHRHLRVGFNTTPLFGPAASFIADLTRRGGPDFVADLDYVGLDFFPDVFHPVAVADLAGAVEWLLRRHRVEALTPAGLGAVPLRITEHGWPTGPDRPAARQAEVVDIVLRTLAAVAPELLVDGYSHFALRDADSTRASLFHRFGLLTDDYTRKPAFDVYRKLVEELGDGTTH